MGDAASLACKKEDKLLKKLYLRGIFLAFVPLPVFLKTFLPGKFKDVMFYPARKDLIIEFFHLGIGNVERVACSL